mgnify:CR=1 FL=1
MKNASRVPLSKFPPYEGSRNRSIPACGANVWLSKLVRKLSDKGIKTEEIIAEDWGWYIPVQNEGFRLAICCVATRTATMMSSSASLIQSTPVAKKFFKKIDATAQLTRLTEAMQQILSADPEIKEVVWKGPDLATNCRFEKFRARKRAEAIDDRSVAAVWNARLLT